MAEEVLPSPPEHPLLEGLRETFPLLQGHQLVWRLHHHLGHQEEEGGEGEDRLPVPSQSPSLVEWIPTTPP